MTSKLAALHLYQLAHSRAARRRRAASTRRQPSAGSVVFNGKAKCATCHVPPIFTEPGWNMHTAAEIGIDDFQANARPTSATARRRSGALRRTQKGGFYHDGRFATLGDVVKHYDDFLKLGLSEAETKDLVEYLKSL